MARQTRRDHRSIMGWLASRDPRLSDLIIHGLNNCSPSRLVMISALVRAKGCRACMRTVLRSSVAQLLIAVSSAALGDEVEQVPQRLDGVDVAWFLPGLGGCVEKLRALEVADRLGVVGKIHSPSWWQLPDLHAICTCPAPFLHTRELRCCNNGQGPQGGSAASVAWPGCGKPVRSS